MKKKRRTRKLCGPIGLQSGCNLKRKRFICGCFRLQPDKLIKQRGHKGTGAVAPHLTTEFHFGLVCVTYVPCLLLS